MGKYDKIINLSHHVSKTRSQQPMSARAAQFAPFAALTGYDECVNEAARFVDEKQELSDEQLQELNTKIQYLQEHLSDEPVVAITFFVPDSTKDGGKYITEEGKIKRIDQYNHVIIFTDGTTINLSDVVDIKSEVLPSDY